MDRRRFLKGASAAAAVGAVSGSGGATGGLIPKRKLGKTGEMLSIIGYGGIVAMGQDQNAATRQILEAIDRGVNYFDVAPSYGDTEAERRLGPALLGRRDQVFLACKTTRRDKQGASDELRESLKRLRTDRFDLYQLHGLPSLDDAKKALGPGGAIEAFVEAREQGLIKYLGFSAHSVEAALYCIEHFDFDTILFPFNFVSFTKGGFGPQVLEAATKKKMGVLALKAMARQLWPEGAERNSPKCWYEPVSDPAEAEMALRFTLSLPITSAIPPGDEKLFPIALDAASRFKPITAGEKAKLMAEAATLIPVFTHKAA